MRQVRVGELTAELARLVEGSLPQLLVTGELRQLQEPASGHAYFVLGDGDAVLHGVVWKTEWARARRQPKVGMTVVARGRLKVWAPMGRHQLYAMELRPAGEGEAAKRLEQARARLAAEGLMDPRRRRALPPSPRIVGLVTSLAGAAIHDFLRVATERFPSARILVSPATVQGVDAPRQIADALALLVEDGRAEVIVVARGGGGKTDLDAFQDEDLARTIATLSPVPVVTAIGHETDTSLCDEVADARAPTPTAAAVLVLPDRAERAARIDALFGAALSRLARRLDAARARLEGLRRLLRAPAQRVAESRRRRETLIGRLEAAMTRRFERAKGRQGTAAARLTALSPLATLQRGYAVVRTDAGRVVRSPDEVADGERLSVDVARGGFVVRVDGA